MWRRRRTNSISSHEIAAFPFENLENQPTPSEAPCTTTRNHHTWPCVDHAEQGPCSSHSVWLPFVAVSLHFSQTRIGSSIRRRRSRRDIHTSIRVRYHGAHVVAIVLFLCTLSGRANACSRADLVRVHEKPTLTRRVSASKSPSATYVPCGMPRPMNYGTQAPHNVQVHLLSEIPRPSNTRELGFSTRLMRCRASCFAWTAGV